MVSRQADNVKLLSHNPERYPDKYLTFTHQEV